MSYRRCFARWRDYLPSRTLLALCVCCALPMAHSVAQRLPDNAIPENYRLTLAPDLEHANFTGDETITVRVRNRTSQIVLNSADIAILDASISDAGTAQKASVVLDPKRETATLTVNRPIAPGRASIHIQYTGTLNDEMRGFYLGKDDEGRRYAATQFEATDARRAFPCFDEPAYKATFDLTLIADKSLVTLSNSKIISESPGITDNQRVITFATTPKISSYLAAWVVGQFDYVEGSADGIPVRVYTTPGKRSLGTFALNMAQQSLRFYDHYFGIKYPYGKLDLIGLPDFSAGAMENVGLITSRAAFLLVDERKGALSFKKAVALTVTHEIAHQWFGDLVTMHWWDDLWLNEGFATWMEEKPVNAWKPEWQVGLDELDRGDTLSTLGAMNIDSLANTRPIRQPAETADQIQELFDDIAYGKSAAVLRMMEAYVGPGNFRNAVRVYLKRHAYANATAVDFWTTVARVTHKPVDKLMSTFVDQPGVPVLLVHTRDIGTTTSVSVEQHRYIDGVPGNTQFPQTWSIPVCMRAPMQPVGRSMQRCEVLNDSRSAFSFSPHPAWVLVNEGAHGYYRSSYAPETIETLARHAQTELTPAERIGLLGDTWAAVRAGRLPIADYLSLCEGFQSERVASVLGYLSGQLQFIGDNLTTASDRPTYQTWLRSIFGPIATGAVTQAKPEESEDRNELRAVVLSALGKLARDPDAIAQAHELTERALRDPDSVESALASAALNVAAVDGNAALFDRLMASISSAKTPEQYYRHLSALTAFTDPPLLRRTLDFALSDAVRSQDALNLVSAVTNDPAKQRLAWEFIESHWDAIIKSGGPFESAQIQGNAGAICDAPLRDQITEFFASHEVAAADRTLKQSLEQINHCIELKSAQSAQLASWLAGRTGGASSPSLRSRP